MKKNKFIWLTVAVVATVLSFVSSCKEEEPVNFAPELEIRGTREVLRQSAMLMGNISGNVSQVTEYGFQLSTSDEFPKMGLIKGPVDANPSTGSFEVHVPGLEAGETYYYRAYATTGAVEVYSPMDQFTTLASSAPKLTYMGSGDPGEDNVTISCRIDEVGDEYLIEYGVQYRLKASTDPYISVKAENIDEGNHYEVTVTGLSAEKEYEFRPYAQNSDTSDGKNGFRIGYGSVIYVTTAKQQSAIVTTNSIEEDNKGMSLFTISGLIADAPGSDGAVDSCGFCYSTISHTPDLADDYVKVDFPGLNKTFKATITGLSMNTTYYVRAFAANTVDGEARFGYGETFEVTTKPLSSPIISWAMNNETNHEYVESTVNTIHAVAQIVNYEEEVLVEKGLIWSPSKPNIDIATAKEAKTFLVIDTKDDKIDGTIEGLEVGKNYYVRAYAKFKMGDNEKEDYSDYQSIRTQSLESATLIDFEVTDVTFQSANLSCAIASEGNGKVKEKGFLLSEYYDLSIPTLTDTVYVTKYMVDGESFAKKIEKLKFSTRYSVRAYAITEIADKTEVAYSDIYTFYTSDIKSSTFYSVSADSATYKTVLAKGGIQELGDGELLEKGFYWYESNSSFANRDSMKVTTGTNASFSLNIDNLKTNTGYYVGIYAKNKAGDYEKVSYSNASYAYTPSIVKATLNDVTIVSDSTTYRSLHVKSGIKSLGDGELLEKGFCWYDYYYSSFDNRDSLAVTTGTNDAYELKIDGLNANTNYRVRAYVKTKVGDKIFISYSNTSSATTKSVESVSFNSVSFVSDSTTYHSLYVKGGIKSVGDGELLEKGFYWYNSNSGYENTDSMVVTSGKNDAYELKIDGLSPNTYYYVGAYAKTKLDGVIKITRSSTSGQRTSGLTLPFKSISTDSVTYSSMIVKSGITEVKEVTLIEKGFCWKQGGSPTLDDNTGSTKVESDSIQAFSYKIEGLLPGKSYYVRAYAKVQEGEAVYVTYGDYSYVYTQSLDYNINRTPYDTTCDMEVTFNDNEVDISAVYVYVTSDYENRYDSSKMTKYTLTKDEALNKFTGTLDNLTQSTIYYYQICYVFNGQEVVLRNDSFNTGRQPGIDDAVSPDKKE